MEQQQAATWRELLGSLIENVRERQRLAVAVCVNVATLQRWVRDRTVPREEHLVRLLEVLPAHIYPAFARLVAVDFPDLVPGPSTSDQPGLERVEIPAEFYRRVLDAFTYTPWPMCQQAVQDLLLQQLMGLLNPARRGLSLSIVRCMPPREHGQVMSLREVGGIGTHPWKHDLEQKTFFFGAESLVGHAVAHFGTRVVNSREELTFYPAHWTEYEQSAAAYPILRHARVAGGLVASCADEHFFTAAHSIILERYADLAALLFAPEDFYAGEAINLRMMPSYKDQMPFFRDFNQRVLRKFAEFLRAGRQISLQEARLSVWQDLEAELLRSS